MIQGPHSREFNYWTTSTAAVILVAAISALYCNNPKTEPVADPMQSVASGTYVAACHADASLTEAFGPAVVRWSSSALLDNVAGTTTITHDGFADDACASGLLSLKIGGTYDLEHDKGAETLDLSILSTSTTVTPSTDETATALTAAKLCGLTYTKGSASELSDAVCGETLIIATGHRFYSIMSVASGGKSFTLGATFSANANTVSGKLASYSYTMK